MATTFVPVPVPGPVNYPVTIAQPVAVPPVHIAFINNSSTSDANVKSVIAALQRQVNQSFSHFWEINAQLHFYPKGIVPPSSYWKIVLSNNTDVPGTLGYHIPPPNAASVPSAKVFVTDANAVLGNGNWSITASHELLEMLADPYGTQASFLSNSIFGPIFVLQEINDPVQANSYSIGGFKVSNFVTPAWYNVAARAPFDVMGVVPKPFTVLQGGSVTYFTVLGEPVSFPFSTSDVVLSKRLELL